jgi:D-3-phosphoglycerate dehydrogenase
MSFYPGGVELVRRARGVRWDDPKVGNWHEDADGLMIRLNAHHRGGPARAKRLKAVVKQGVGVDNIDLAAARATGGGRLQHRRERGAWPS